MSLRCHLRGEAKVTGIAPGADQIVNIEWSSGLVPPPDVMGGGTNIHWHPRLLAEITPDDGPTAMGNDVWDDDNLGQKNIPIVNADVWSDFSFAIVVGHEENMSEYPILELYRGRLLCEVQLFIDLVDLILRRRIRKYAAGSFKQLERQERLDDGGARFGTTTAVLAAPALQYAQQVPPAITPGAQMRPAGLVPRLLRRARDCVPPYARG